MPYLTISDTVACLCILRVMIGVLEALCLAKLSAHVFSWFCLGLMILIASSAIIFLMRGLSFISFEREDMMRSPKQLIPALEILILQKNGLYSSSAHSVIFKSGLRILMIFFGFTVLIVYNPCVFII
jgi:hypothetical protein